MARSAGTVQAWQQLEMLAGAIVRVDDPSFAQLLNEGSHSITVWKLTEGELTGPENVRAWIKYRGKRPDPEVIDSGFPVVNALRLDQAAGILKRLGYVVDSPWHRGPGGDYAHVIPVTTTVEPVAPAYPEGSLICGRCGLDDVADLGGYFECRMCGYGFGGES
jgi:hypothetical protein